MEGNSFWLIYIQDNLVSASLVVSGEETFKTLSTGPDILWDNNAPESLNKAIDESLSNASISANITEDQEPSLAAFVIPPYWVGSDNKITPSKLKVIKDACKKLSLKPTGFLTEDESIVEDTNSQDSFPASFILLHLSPKEFYLSLVYLGRIKQRISKPIEEEFTGQLVEAALLELNSESTLPPQIVVFGQTDSKVIDLLKDFPWVGKKNIETFLHFPEIKYLSPKDTIDIYSRVISSQTNPGIRNIPPIDDFASSNESEPELKEEALTEANPDSLGFYKPEEINNLTLPPDSFHQTDHQPVPDIVPEPNLDPFEPQIMPPVLSVNKNKKFLFSFQFLKKIRLPKFHLKTSTFFWVFLFSLPFILFLPLFLIKSQIIFFMNPYEFNKTFPVTFKIGTDSDQISKSVIPVEKKSFDIVSQATINTTGQKTVGEKAKGEIVIFNKVDKTQNIPKGSILIDPTGKKFELASAVSVAASTSDLQQGIISLGQTKTAVMAFDIGSEYNINAETQLTFSDFSDTLLIARSINAFTGGNRQQIPAVSQQDKNSVQEKINQQIDGDIDTKIANDFNNLPGGIKETLQIKKSNLDLNREVGEESNQLTATINSSVSIFIVSDETKKLIISQYLSSENDFDKIELDPNNFQISFKPTKIESDQAVGSLTLTGSSLPKLDLTNIKKNLVLKTVNQADGIIKKLVPRANRFKIYNKLFIMPLRFENIDIQVKLEKL